MLAIALNSTLVTAKDTMKACKVIFSFGGFVLAGCAAASALAGDVGATAYFLSTAVCLWLAALI